MSLAEEVKGKVDEMWAQFDTNNNGTLEKAEFQKFYDAMPEGLNEIASKDNFEDVFAFFDTNGNGVVDKAEMTAILTVEFEK